MTLKQQDSKGNLPKHVVGIPRGGLLASTCGLVAMTSAQHAEGRQFDPGQVYDFVEFT